MATATANQPRRIDLRSEVHKVYHDAFVNQDRWLVLYGGANSGKSWVAGQKVLVRTMMDAKSRIVCTRKVARTIKNSTYLLLTDILDRWGIRHLFAPNKTEHELIYKPNGNQILSMGLDDVEKMKSLQQPTSFWHEEPTEMTSKDLTQLDLRMRGMADTYFQNILTFNPISRTHWLKKRFIDNPKANATTLKTTYLDNEHLGAQDVYQMEQLKRDDPEMYQIYGLGDWGELTGLIYKPFIVDHYPPIYEETVYGIDFGFANPTTVIECNVWDREVYLKELFYESGYTSGQFVEWLATSGISKTACIYADSAQPDRIAEIRAAGYNVYPAAKGPGSVHAGIMFCRSIKLHTTPDNVNLNNEVATYKWRVDKDGNPIDEPVKKKDHALDAVRYALFTHWKPEPEQDRQEMVMFDTIQQMIGADPIGAFDGM